MCLAVLFSPHFRCNATTYAIKFVIFPINRDFDYFSHNFRNIFVDCLKKRAWYSFCGTSTVPPIRPRYWSHPRPYAPHNIRKRATTMGHFTPTGTDWIPYHPLKPPA